MDTRRASMVVRAADGIVAEKESTAQAEPTSAAVAAPSRVPVIVIGSSRRWIGQWVRDLWEYRELLYFLVWRDVKVRYKQTAIGAGWAVLQPLLAMVIFTVIFGKFARIPSDGLPYPIFAYTALLPWQYFAGALTRAITSMVASAHLISKVYFPRLVIPLAASVSGLVDFGIAFVILIGMMAWFSFGLRWSMLTVPLFLLLAMMTALSAGLWLSVLNVRYRDVGHSIPFLIQVWMYASPVVYPASLVPGTWRVLYGLNPMVGVIEGFRWALLGKQSPDLRMMAVSASVVAATLVAGILYFRQMERTIADVI